MGEEETTNNRVTTREFYNAQLKTIELIHEVKDDLMAEIKPVIAKFNQVDNNTKEIDILRKRSNIFDGINGLIAILAAGIAAAIGKAP